MTTIRTLLYAAAVCGILAAIAFAMSALPPGLGIFKGGCDYYSGPRSEICN